jgi:hypothetical protein
VMNSFFMVRQGLIAGMHLQNSGGL